MALAHEKRNSVYLIGSYDDNIRGTKLPSKKQVLSFFLYNHTIRNETVRISATMTAEKIMKFWNSAGIPIHHKQDCIKKVTRLFENWKGIKKNAGRRTATQERKEEVFKSSFENLFDIAHANALELMTNEEDIQFLIAQREPGRRGSMASVDVNLKNKEERKRKRKEEVANRQRKASEYAQGLKAQVAFESSSSDSTSEEDEDPVQGPSTKRPSIGEPSKPIKRGYQHVLSQNLAATLDRNKVSDRAAVMLIGETARSLGQDIQPLALNRSSIRRQRLKQRKTSSKQIQDNFDPQFSVIVHWDGKILPDLTGTATVDRLPVLLSGNSVSQLLAVPKLPSGTGKDQSEAVFSVLKEWKLEEKVQGMCFDTTYSNTGQHKGACILLEQLLGRELLHLACRHHILELVAGAAFSAAMGYSTAPVILLSKRFKAAWQHINKTDYRDSSTEEETAEAVADVKDEMVQMLVKAVQVTQPRDDYRELLELTLIFLGAVPPRGIHFLAPGAMHQARWMAKVIYSFKVWMFRSEFKLTVRECRGLQELCIFFSRIYVKAWVKVSIASHAPKNNLQMLKECKMHHSFNQNISAATLKKLAGQLWYLSEELVSLALFDEDLDESTKD